MGRRCGLRLLAAALAVSAGALLPATVAAHPLGNFTINHYAGLTIAPDRIDLDVIIDMAEIPTFQERQKMDGDGDGSIADDEASSWAAGACSGLIKHFILEQDNVSLATVSGASAIAFPAGAGGLSTLRLECAYTIPLARQIDERSSSLSFADTSYLDRLGWREIVATGQGTLLDTHGLPATSSSQKLTSYPAALIATPLDVRSATIDVRLDPAGPRPTPTPAAGAIGAIA
nr:hypothetical protein [Chloroflexota bacterium]